MSKITRISAALALMVAVVSGCKSNNNTVPDGGAGCGCGGAMTGPVSGVGTPVSTPHSPMGMTSPTSGATQMSPMPTGSSFAPSTTGMSGGQFTTR